MPTIEQAPTQESIDAAKTQAEADRDYLEGVYQNGDLKTPEDQQALAELAQENAEAFVTVNGDKVKAELGKESIAQAAQIAKQQMEDESNGPKPDTWQIKQ